MSDAYDPRAGLLGRLALQFPALRASPEYISALAYRLRDMPVEALALACDRAGNACRFMPSVAELRELAGEIPAAARAAIAWDAFYGARNRYASVEFDDPVIHAVARHMGGWALIWAETLTESLPHVRREFEAAYVRYLAAGLPPGTPSHLPGEHELACAATGHPSPSPKRITTGLPQPRVAILGARVHPCLPPGPK